VGTTAGFQLIIYDKDDCTGSKLDIANSAMVSGSDWKVVPLTHPMPTLARSLVLRLASIKPYREAPNGVLFDNLLVHPVQ
jgi:hypothetical protein